MKHLSLFLLFAALAANAADSTAVPSAASTRDAHRARMISAIEAHDYEAWKAERDAWGARGLAGQNVTKENFETFVRLHEAVQAGRTDEASALRQQLGLGQGRGNGPCKAGIGGRQGQGRGQGMGMGAGNGNGGRRCRKGS